MCTNVDFVRLCPSSSAMFGKGAKSPVLHRSHPRAGRLAPTAHTGAVQPVSQAVLNVYRSPNLWEGYQALAPFFFQGPRAPVSALFSAGFAARLPEQHTLACLQSPGAISFTSGSSFCKKGKPLLGTPTYFPSCLAWHHPVQRYTATKSRTLVCICVAGISILYGKYIFSNEIDWIFQLTVLLKEQWNH